ncbi:hypothetical protein CNEO4_480020 [Clostridium neonatale]|nr:hypothetical protein CNEO4_480020 [Clostridium neonatale]
MKVKKISILYIFSIALRMFYVKYTYTLHKTYTYFMYKQIFLHKICAFFTYSLCKNICFFLGLLN